MSVVDDTSPSYQYCNDIFGDKTLFLGGEPLSVDASQPGYNTLLEEIKITRIVRVMPLKFDPVDDLCHKYVAEKFQSLSSKEGDRGERRKEEADDDQQQRQQQQREREQLLYIAKNNEENEDEKELQSILMNTRILQIPVHDMPIESILPYFSIATKFIETHLSTSSAKNNDERIFVHCQAGVSRSVSVVLAYLVKAKRMPLQNAFDFLRERRPQIRPNLGFVEQLAAWEKQVFTDDDEKKEKLFDLDGYVLQSYIKRFSTQLPTEEIRTLFYEKANKTRNAGLMQRFVFERAMDLNSGDKE